MRRMARRPHLVSVLAGGGAIIAVIVGLTVWAIENGRATAERAAEVATTNLAETLADNFNSTIRQIDLGLMDLEDELARQDRSGHRDEREINAAIARQDARHPDSLGFRIYGADGFLRYGLRNIADRKADLTKTAPFIALRDNPSIGLSVNPPGVGVVTRQARISLSRRITNADGSFGGAIYSSIPISALTQAFGALNLGPGGTVALYHSSFVLAARWPVPSGPDNPVGTVRISDQLRAIVASGATSSHYSYTSVVDGVRRTAHVRKVEGTPYFVLVGFSANDYLAEWRRDSLGLILLAASMVALVLLGMPMALRRIDDHHRREALLQARVALADLSMTHSLRNLLVAALDLVNQLTGAEAGFYFVLEDDQTIVLQAWSSGTMWEVRHASSEPVHYPLAEEGIWAECLHLRHSVIDNNHNPFPACPGLPACLADPRQLLLVPLFRQERIVAIIGFGNKAGGFDRNDLAMVENLADLVWDSTERKRAEEIAALRAEELASSNADLEQFAYVASHDLRTPLRSIVSYAQLLERRYKGKLDADADDFIAFIVDSGKRMTLLISDLLEYSRVSSQSKPLHPVAADEAVAEALDNLRIAIDESEAEITVGPLPTVIGERSLLVSLFQNLLGNGIKYRVADRRPLLSVTAWRASPDTWHFAVADNGIGIETQYFDKIFQLFQRLDPCAETEGTGIGLTVCRRIVQRLGGTIWVESTPGQGSTFLFSLKDAGAAAGQPMEATALRPTFPPS